MVSNYDRKNSILPFHLIILLPRNDNANKNNNNKNNYHRHDYNNFHQNKANKTVWFFFPRLRRIYRYERLPIGHSYANAYSIALITIDSL